MRGGLVSLLLVFAALLVAPGSAQEAPARFSWPSPARLEVIETIEKSGKVRVLKQRHRVRVWRDESESELRVHVHASEIIEIDGRDTTAPEAQRELAPMVFPFPVWRVGPRGELLGMVDVAGSITRWLDILRAAAPPDRLATLERMREQLTSPAWLATYEERLREIWEAWAGAWADASLVPGARREARRTVPFFGRSLDASSTLETLEPSEGGHARLRRVVTLDGEAARDAYQAMLVQLAPAGRTAPEVSAYRLESTLEVQTDPVTLLPARATLVRGERTSIAGRPPLDTTERRTWTFTVLPSEPDAPR